MEKLQNIIENSNDNSRKYESVYEELIDYQLQYIEKLDNGEIKIIGEKKEKENFRDLLKSSTSLPQTINDEYCKRIPCHKNIEEKMENFCDMVLNEIYENYLKDKIHFRENVKQIIKNNLDKIGNVVNSTESIDGEYKKFGLIHFDVIENEKLSEFGIGPNESCLSIHLGDLCKQKENNQSVSNIFSGQSLEKIACEIVDKYQYIKAIIGKSWLIDSPIGKRVGFTKYDQDSTLRNGGFWGQFINEKGQINKERIKKFLETGEADYYVSMGFIKTEDFLRKYLPKDRRGWIKLENRTKEASEFIKDFNDIFKEINTKFTDLSFEDILLIMNRNIIFSNYLKTNEGKKILDMFKKTKELKVKSLDDLEFEGKDEIREKLKEFIKKSGSIYINKEVFID